MLASALPLALGGLAGCSSSETNDSGADTGDTNTVEPTDATTEKATEVETDTTEATVDLRVSDATITTVGTGIGEDIVGEATVKNNGAVQTDSFLLGLDWLDESDEYIATTDVYGIFLDPGQTWKVRSPAWLDVDNPEEIASVEASITEIDPWGELEQNPDGVELVEQNIRAGSDEVVVRGQIKNNRQTKEFIEVAGKATNAAGDVLATSTTIEEVASGDTWRFEMTPLTYGRNNQVDSGVVIPYL